MIRLNLLGSVSKVEMDQQFPESDRTL